MLLEEIKQIQSAAKDLRKFGLTVGIFLAILGGVLFWLDKFAYPYFLVGGFILALLGLSLPGALKPLQKIWMAIAIVIGWIMTRVILGILYYLILTPVAIIAKLAGKQFLELKWDRSQKTYWNYRESQEIDKSVYEKQF